MHANRAKTHCKRGHPFDPLNTYAKPDGSRQCRACRDRYRQLGEAGRRADRQARKEQAELSRRSAAERQEARNRAAQEAALNQMTREAEALQARIREAQMRLITKTYCTRGHELPPGEKRCKKCAQSFAIRRYYAKKGA